LPYALPLSDFAQNLFDANDEHEEDVASVMLFV
jgi:hypothetical protein